MALVEIITDNLYAGANLRKLEVGAIVEVDDATAARWKATGKAKDTDKKKGEKLFGESVPAASQPSDLIEQLAAVTKERDESLEQLAKLTDQAAADKITFDEQLAAVTKRAEEAEAALAEATKKAK
ncbi:hypothetical protein [Enterobacter hormaechei]|uniref:hypothetical protein n=1 Tax=Enterobacter hormaechei TaxID=158836 RepID=UPI000BA18353|nr:hypothetical protein [Enterobacter hormaechei]MBT1722176.1 hypothetical protein [Enterobacter hormaechei subsp. hoffmannii]ELE6460876.1 hypothetical protein [Enterobacter hormaechei]MCL8114479.1 hypothetical protein [Enterobacter hormaechei]MCM8208418.1 hypothetical protein [Enterobacter hormaechei]MDA4780694.1 hypothetical protein [Enterobacter hormaechei]